MIPRYKLHPIDHRLVEDEYGPFVLWKDASEIIEAIDQRHREVQDAIAEERDFLRKNND